MKQFGGQQEEIDAICTSEVVVFSMPNFLNTYCYNRGDIQAFLSRIKTLPFLYECITMEQFRERMSPQ